MGILETIIIALLIAIVLFLLLREVNCWYFKINKRIELMEETNELLRLLIPTSKSEIIKNNISAEIPVAVDENVSELEAKSITIKNKSTGNLQTLSLNNWAKLKSDYDESNFEIIRYNK